MIVPDKAWPWIGLAVFVLLCAAVPTGIAHFIVAYTPRCTHDSPPGPTIGHVIKLYGC